LEIPDTGFMKVGIVFIFGIAIALGYLSLIAHSWADDSRPSAASRAPAQQEAVKQ
jgi:hypothetical protein